MTKVRIFAAGATAALSLVCLPAPLLAADQPSQGWTVTVRGNVGMSPAWEGSSDLSPFLVPGISIRRAGTAARFTAPDDAPGIAILDVDWLKAGPAARLKGPRQSGNYSQLRGMQDIDWTLEVGGFAEFWPIEKFRARIDIRHAFTGGNGNVMDLSADWVERFGRWTLSIGPRFSLADTTNMNTLFGVTPFEAFWNGRVTPYYANGGAKSFGLTAAAAYRWSNELTTTGYVKYNRLIGSAGSSPLTNNLGTANQFTFGAIVAYSFDWNGDFDWPRF
jgi:MipA family protein